MANLETSNWTGKAVANGRFAVGELLGEGGMGQVYRARDQKNDRDVVIKVPHVLLLRDPEFVERFQREVESVRQLVHPHIVRVLCGGIHNDVPFVVLRYMPGGSLAEKIESTSLSDRMTHLRTWLPQIAEALDFVHDQGFIHRDIKPENIFLDKRGRAYLGDFGIIKSTSEQKSSDGRAGLTMTGAVVGTPEYMAPEMAMGEEYDHRSDQYSLAVAVYESLNGAPPFQGPTPAAVLVQLTTKEVPDLSALHPSIPTGLSAAVSRGLAREPAGRFDSCSEFATAVTQAVDSAAGESTAADPASEFTDWQETTQTAAFTTTAPHEIRPGRRRSKSHKQPLLDSETPFAPLINPVLVRFRKARKKHELPTVMIALCSVVAVAATGTALFLAPWTESGQPNEGLAEQATESRTAPVNNEQPAEDAPDTIPTGLVDELLALQSQVEADASKAAGEKAKNIATGLSTNVPSGVDEKPVVDQKPPNVRTVAATLTLKGHTGQVNSVAFSPDGKWIASSSRDGTARVWDSIAGAQILEKRVGNPVASVAFGPDGKWIASDRQEYNTVDVWDSATGKERPRRRSSSRSLTRHREQMTSVAYSPDGNWLASGSWDKTVKIWDARTGVETRTLTHSDLVVDVEFSSDSKQVASASSGQINLWNANTGDGTLTLKHSNARVLGLAFSSDNKQIASASEDRTVKLWDAVMGQELLTLKGHTSIVNSVVFSPDGLRLASASWDDTVKVWDAATGGESLTLNGHTGPVMSVSFSPDGQRLASASLDKTVRVWDVSSRTGTLVPGEPAGPTSLITTNKAAGSNPGVGTLPKATVPQRSAESIALEGKQAGDEWSRNGLGMPFSWCPAGTFVMGSPRNEPGRDVDEDQVQVTLSKGYWLARYETTQQQWQQVMSQSPWSGQFDGVDGKDLPATHVTWNLAMEFCQKLTASERQAGRLPSDWMYSLPTEAQWEYACRASTRTPYWFGADAKYIGDCAWSRFNSNGAIYAVGTKRANPWGLHDVTGNAWEWCRDYASTKLPGKTDPEVTAGGSRRALKGGGFLTSRGNYRSGDRSSLVPEIGVIGNPAEIGFRVALVRDSRQISIPDIQPGPPRIRVIRNGEIFAGVRRFNGITETTGFRMTARKGHRITVEMQYNQRLDANGQTSVLGLIQYFDGVIVGNTMDLICRRVNLPAFADNVGWRIQLSVSDGSCGISPDQASTVQ